MNPLTMAGAGLVLLLILMIVVVFYSIGQHVNAPCDSFKELPMPDETNDAEQRYDRLRADVRAARDKIGDTPGIGAGLTAIALLERVLDRHPPILNEYARQQAREATPCPDGGECRKAGATCGDPICVQWDADLKAQEATHG